MYSKLGTKLNQVARFGLQPHYLRSNSSFVHWTGNRDSAVGRASRLGAGDREILLRFPAGKRKCSVL